MIGLQEYDLEIKPVHMVKGHGLSRLAAKALHALEGEEELSDWEQEVEMYDIGRETPTKHRTSWYADVHKFLKHDIIPSHFSIRQERALHLKYLAYQLCTKCFTGSTTMEFFSGAWRHMNKRRCYKICMKDPSGVTLWETPLHKMLCQPISTSHIIQGCTCLCTQVPSLSMTHRQNTKVSSPIAPYCSNQTIPIMGLGNHWGNF